MDPFFDEDTDLDDPGWDIEGWDDEAAPWSVPAGTPACPDGHPQRLLEILGFRMKSPDCLQLRAVLYWGERGCVPIVDEQPRCVRVSVVACWDPYEVPCRHSLVDPRGTDCPFRVWLDAPLGSRPVIDLDTGEELPFYLPGSHLDEPSRYVPRPPGDVWPPINLEDYERRKA